MRVGSGQRVGSGRKANIIRILRRVGLVDSGGFIYEGKARAGMSVACFARVEASAACNECAVAGLDSGDFFGEISLYYKL